MGANKLHYAYGYMDLLFVLNTALYQINLIIH